MRVELPDSVRYVKNGGGGRWWPAALERGQVHAGWSDIPGSVVASKDMQLVADTLRRTRYAGDRRGFQNDYNQLAALLDRPSQHVWITFEAGDMWWCTVKDDVTVSQLTSDRLHGSFWLTCSRPWQNTSLNGRKLSISNLPGVVTRTKGFRDTVCTPAGWKEMLRVIRDQVDPIVVAAERARDAYVAAVQSLISRLHEKDFEALIDLILARSGWARLDRVGGVTEGTDLEAENAAIDEVAFVQIKSSAGQRELNESIENFRRRPRFNRMIFAVHTPNQKTELSVPTGFPGVHLWTGAKIAELVVKHGLGDWVGGHV